MSKTKVLFLDANPIKKNILSLDEEIRAITEEIRTSDHSFFGDMISPWAARIDGLLQSRPLSTLQLLRSCGAILVKGVERILVRVGEE